MWIALATAAVATLLAAGLAACSNGDEEGGLAVAKAIPLGFELQRIETGEGGVWVSSNAEGLVSRIDPRENVGRSTPIEGEGGSTALAVGEGSVWLGALLDNGVWRIDPETRKVAKKPIVVIGPVDAAPGEGAIWIVDTARRVVTVDPMKRKLVGKPIATGTGVSDFSSIAVGSGSVWVASFESGTVTRVDPETRRIVGKPIRVGKEPSGITVGEGSVWVANNGSGTVSRIDPSTSAVIGKPIRVTGASEVDVGAGFVWVASRPTGTVSRIDPKTDETVGEPIRTVPESAGFGKGPVAVAAGEGAVWIANGNRTVSRISTAR